MTDLGSFCCLDEILKLQLGNCLCHLCLKHVLFCLSICLFYNSCLIFFRMASNQLRFLTNLKVNENSGSFIRNPVIYSQFRIVNSSIYRWIFSLIHGVMIGWILNGYSSYNNCIIAITKSTTNDNKINVFDRNLIITLVLDSIVNSVL